MFYFLMTFWDDKLPYLISVLSYPSLPLDIPDYRDKETLMNKLTYAVDHATTFEIV